jgi:serine protease Do
MGWLQKTWIGPIALIVAASSATAGEAALTGNARWVVLASRSDIDEAIGVARYHRWQHPTVRVMRSANGWFAVVFGPEQISNPRAARDKLAQSGNLPKDFIFSRGDNYAEQVWSPQAPAAQIVKYDGKRDAFMQIGEISVQITSSAKKGGSERHPVAIGRRNGRVIFTMSLDESTRDSDDSYSTDFAELTSIRLDPSTKKPQLVFTSYWNGAHCCTVTKIASEDPGTGQWNVAQGETLDGGGYGFEDIDGDGAYELVNGDNSFLYAFGPYASANSPSQISRIRNGRLEKVTQRAEYAPYLRQRLASMEHGAGIDTERWRDNNFLGGWVAQSILVGRGDQAWARVPQLYDRQSDWPLEMCVERLPIAKCPEVSKRKIDFLTALRRHLDENGYGSGTSTTRTTPSLVLPSGPPQYEAAASQFDRLSVDERIKLQVLLTATGHQVAVPNPAFSKRLFETLMRYQTQTGQRVTGMVDATGMAALLSEAIPLLRTWNFRNANHPTRGRPIWVPVGLGLREDRNSNGVVWSDPQKRMILSYTSAPDDLETSFRSALARFEGNGTRVNYKVIRPDFFAISATGTDGLDWYVRFHRDGPGVLGFFLTWKSVETDLHMERVAVLVSGSLWASMTGAAFTEPPTFEVPPAAVAVARPTEPVVPTPPAIAPKPSDDKPRQTSSSGTGFFVSRDGHLLTNAHVVSDCAVIEVNGPNGLVRARLVAKDSSNDLALLKTEITPLKVAAVRTGVRLGEAVAVFGYPLSGMLSTSGNFTLGNITALTGLSDDSRYFQISAPVQPGNSGGPLVDANGNLIGVVTAKLNALKVMVATNGDIPQNVNFAIKGSAASIFLESNGVAFATGGESTALQPADLAEHAKSMSVYVACR